MSETPILQIIANCRLEYDLSSHSLTVVDNVTGTVKLRIQPIPDNPGGFNLIEEGNAISIHNPAGVDFVGVHDMYEDNKNAGL